MIILLILLISFMLALYVLLTSNFNYWRKRNIPYEEPSVLVGNLWPLLSRQMSLGEFLKNVYEKHPNQPYVGIFLGGSPCLVVRDFEVAHTIVNKELESFATRIVQFEKKREPILNKTIFSLKLESWKSARQRITPSFTTLKLKHYYSEMKPIVHDLHKCIENNPEQDITKLSWAFTVDVINHCLFGLNSKALLNPNDELLKLSKELFRTDIRSTVAKFCLFAAPSLYSLFGMKAFPDVALNVIKKLTLDMMEAFNKGELQANNLMSSLNALMNTEMEKPGQEPFEFDANGVVAQVFAFLGAGTDTLTSTLTYSIYELAKHPHLQDRLREEVRDAFPDGIDSFTYDKVTGLKFLSSVVMETSRLHPSFPFLDRICSKDIVLPGTNSKITKGVFVFVAMWGMHMDKDIWENPEKFNPDRFADIDDIKNKPYFPFGIGIRRCIGMKFAFNEAQLYLASLVYRWQWKLAPGLENAKHNPLTYTTLPDRPLKVTFEPIN